MCCTSLPTHWGTCGIRIPCSQRQQHVELNRRGARNRRGHAGDREVFGPTPLPNRQVLAQRVGVPEQALSHFIAQDDGVALGLVPWKRRPVGAGSRRP